MKFIEISFERTYTVGAYQNERINAVASIDEGDNIQDVIDAARKEVWENHKRNNPHLYQEQDKPVMTFHKIQDDENGKLGVFMPTEKQPEITIGKGTIEEQIEAFEGTLDQLIKEWNYVAVMNPKYKKVFDKKLAELQKQTV